MILWKVCSLSSLEVYLVYCVQASVFIVGFFQHFVIFSITSRYRDREDISQLPSSQLCRTMGNFKSCHGPLILMLLLQIRSFNMEAVEPVSQKLRRLKDQVGINLCMFNTVCCESIIFFFNFHIWLITLSVIVYY